MSCMGRASTAEPSHGAAVQALSSCACADGAVCMMSQVCMCVCVQPELHGMLPVEEGQFSGLQCMAMR